MVVQSVRHLSSNKNNQWSIPVWYWWGGNCLCGCVSTFFEKIFQSPLLQVNEPLHFERLYFEQFLFLSKKGRRFCFDLRCEHIIYIWPIQYVCIFFKMNTCWQLQLILQIRIAFWLLINLYKIASWDNKNHVLVIKIWDFKH